MRADKEFKKAHEHYMKYGFIKKDNPHKRALERYSRIAAGMNPFEGLIEHLGRNASSADYIHDFVNSSNPRFKGHSRKKRIKQALAAYYSVHKNQHEDTINELSPQKIGKYIEKAAPQLGGAMFNVGRETQGAKPSGKFKPRTAVKRQKGLFLAAKRLSATAPAGPVTERADVEFVKASVDDVKHDLGKTPKANKSLYKQRSHELRKKKHILQNRLKGMGEEISLPKLEFSFPTPFKKKSALQNKLDSQKQNQPNNSNAPIKPPTPTVEPTKTVKEDGEGAPTNSMGLSSTNQGPIQTYDPLLGYRKKKTLKNILRRR